MKDICRCNPIIRTFGEMKELYKDDPIIMGRLKRAENHMLAMGMTIEEINARKGICRF